MSRHLFHRLGTVLFVVLSLLLSQLALANYVCPREQDMAAMAEMMAAGVPCEGVDQDQPALCAEHSSSAAQSSESAKLPVLTPPMLVQVIELPRVLDARSAPAVPLMATPEVQAPPDPLFLCTRRLRV